MFAMCQEHYGRVQAMGKASVKGPEVGGAGGSVCGTPWLVNKRQQAGYRTSESLGLTEVAGPLSQMLDVPCLCLPELASVVQVNRFPAPFLRAYPGHSGRLSTRQEPPAGPESTVTSLCQFARDIPDFRPERLTVQ